MHFERRNAFQNAHNYILFQKKQDQTLLWTCVAGAHLQCVNNHYAKFQYKRMKSVLITDYM